MSVQVNIKASYIPFEIKCDYQIDAQLPFTTMDGA